MILGKARLGEHVAFAVVHESGEITRARREIPNILANLNNELTAMTRETIADLYDLFRDLDRRIASFDKKIDDVFRRNGS